MYIGITTQQPKIRWRHHRNYLKNGNHSNPYLQNSFNKHGIDSFEFEVLESADSQKDIDEKEIFLIEYLKYIGATVYNLKTGGGFGGSPSAETRKKIGLAGQGRIVSQETCQKISQNTTGVKKTYTPESYARLLASRIGKKHTEEHKRKISEAGKGRKWSQETRAKSAGRKHSEETKELIREKNIGRVISEETRQRMSESHNRRGRQYTFEHESGEIVIVHNVSEFCRQRGLVYQSLLNVVSGKNKSNKGWKLVGKEARL